MSLARRLVNRCRDLMFLPFLDWHWRKQLLGKVMCLLYHRVDAPGACPFLDRFGAPTISTTALFEELGFLQKHGARFLTFADLRNGVFPNSQEFGVIVSFDDGFKGNYTHGLDVLDSLGIRGVMFQATAMVDAETLIWEHALYWYWNDSEMALVLSELIHQRHSQSRLLRGHDLLVYAREQVPVRDLEALLTMMAERFKAAPTMAALARQLYPSGEDLIRAHAKGHELASHGHNHYKRQTIDERKFSDELRQSIAVLHGLVDAAPGAFSYPFNSYLPNDKALCGAYVEQVATVDAALIDADTPSLSLPRFTWPGPHRNSLRRRRWLWTGRN